MKTETVTMHDLNEGDLVRYYGVVFKLRDRKDHGLRPDDDPEMQGACISFRTDVVDASERCSSFPIGWVNEWKFQGNKLKRVCRVTQ